MSTLPSGFNPVSRASRPARKIASMLIPAANRVVYTVPSGKVCEVSTVVFCNTSAATVNFRMFHLIPTETAGTSNALFYDLPVRAYSTTTLEIPLYMTATDRLVCYASTASAVCVTLYGVEA